jgi:hypothetical protein
VSRRHPERDAGGFDLALRSHQSLRHGRRRHEEGARDLVGRKAAQRAQRERDLSIDGERRMAAGEDEFEPFVAKRHRVHRLVHLLLQLKETRLRRERLIAPHSVDGSVAGRCHEPRALVDRVSHARPSLGGDRERLLGGFLGEVEVAEEADHGCENRAPLVAKGLVENLTTP